MYKKVKEKSGSLTSIGQRSSLARWRIVTYDPSPDLSLIIICSHCQRTFSCIKITLIGLCRPKYRNDYNNLNIAHLFHEGKKNTFLCVLAEFIVVDIFIIYGELQISCCPFLRVLFGCEIPSNRE